MKIQKKKNLRPRKKKKKKKKKKTLRFSTQKQNKRNEKDIQV